MATLAEKKAKIQNILATSAVAVERAIVTLYARQTEDEKSSHYTVHLNGRGFNSRDAEFMSSLAEWINKNRPLSPKQLMWGRKLVMKYWRQLIDAADIKTPGWADPPEVENLPTDADYDAVKETQNEIAFNVAHPYD